MAVWNSTLKRENKWKVIRRYERGMAFNLEIQLFTDLTHCRPFVARLIRRWVLGQLPPYPSGCRVCGAERISAAHMIHCMNMNPDRLIRNRFYELAALMLGHMESAIFQI